MRVTVVGQGYVGLPLAIAAAQSGYVVFGLDHNESKISLLISGQSIIEDLADDVIKKSIDSKLFLPTTDESVISGSDLVLICVPTPLSDDHKPDLKT